MQSRIARKPFNQRVRIRFIQLGSALAVGLVLFSQPAFNDPIAHSLIEGIGFGFILACVFGRLWSILFIGAIKNCQLATKGPYSTTRNPLYFFSTLGAFGIGLVFGSFVYAIVLAALSYLVFRVTAYKEAEFLRGQFPDEYRAYEVRTRSSGQGRLCMRKAHAWSSPPKRLKRRSSTRWSSSRCFRFWSCSSIFRLLAYCRCCSGSGRHQPLPLNG